MKDQGVQFNTLSTVNALSEGRGGDVYDFLRSLGSRFMQFLSVVEHTLPAAGRPAVVPPHTPGSCVAEWSVSDGGFGRFMSDIFDRWVVADVGRYYVQLFDAALAQWVGVPPALCSLAETCGDALVVDHNGDVYSCDHFVYEQHRLGNIVEGNLSEMIRIPKQFAFGVVKRNNLPTECIRCPWYFACRGECPKHRFDIAANGERNLNALCEGYKLFFAHIDPYMRVMRQLLENRQPPALVMPWARARMGLG